jgi:hypothetical protein
MALQIRRGTSTNPTLEEGELYLNTDTGVIYTKIGSTVVSINADSSSRSKKLYFNLVNTGVGHDDWSGSSIGYSDSAQFAASTPVVSSVGSGVFSIAFTPALDPDAIMAATVNKTLIPILSGSTLLYYTWGFSAADGLVLAFFDSTLTAIDLELAAYDLMLIFDYLEALPT